MKAIASNGAEIQTGDEVLIRDSKNGAWTYCHFSHMNKNEERKYITAYVSCKYCIPYKGHEDLVGTTKDFPEPFEFKFGAKVKAKFGLNETIIGILIGYKDTLYRVAVNEINDENNCIGGTHWVSKIEYIE